MVAVGLFGATWVAGVVGGIGAALGNDGVARVGTVSRMLLPTDGLWHGAMHAFQDPVALAQAGLGFPFLSGAPLTAAYLAWAAVWGSRRRRSYARTCDAERSRPPAPPRGPAQLPVTC